MDTVFLSDVGNGTENCVLLWNLVGLSTGRPSPPGGKQRAGPPEGVRNSAHFLCAPARALNLGAHSPRSRHLFFDRTCTNRRYLLSTMIRIRKEIGVF